MTIDHRVFRVDKKTLPAKVATGATLHFIVSEPGTARLSIYRLVKNRRRKFAAVDKQVVAGKNAIRFPGRVKVGTLVRTLAPGRYRVDVHVKDAAGNASNSAGVAFTVVRR